MLGRIRGELLRRVTSRAGARLSRVVVHPEPHLDAGVERACGEYRVYSTDPALGVPASDLGYLAFHFSAVDVAVLGAKPELVAVDLLFPPDSPDDLITSVDEQLSFEAWIHGVEVIAGHTGRYAGLEEPVAVVTTIGRTSRLLLPSGISPGDAVLIVGVPGAELLYGVANYRPELLYDEVGPRSVARWRRASRLLSALPQALALSARDAAKAMKDCAEGGVVRALNELASASDLGLEIHGDRIPLPPELERLASRYGFDPLECSSSGALVAAVSPDRLDLSLYWMEALGFPAVAAGRFLPGGEGRWLIRGGVRRELPEEYRDPYGPLLSGDFK